MRFPRLGNVLLLVVAGFVVVGIVYPSPERAPAPPTQEEQIRSWAPGFNEIHAVTDCDMLAKRQVFSPATFSTAWGWTILEHPEKRRVTIQREFDAQNAFGALVRSQYFCLVNAGSNQVIEISFGR